MESYEKFEVSTNDMFQEEELQEHDPKEFGTEELKLDSLEEMIGSEEEETFTKEQIEEYLKTEEGIELLQVLLKKKVTKSIETWENNQLPKILAEHDRKLGNPNEQKIMNLEKEIAKEAHMEAIIDGLGKNRLLPPEFASALDMLPTEKALKKIETISEHVKQTIPVIVKEKVDKRMKGLGE